MSWLTRRLDHLGSAAFGGAGGLSLSQAPAFTNAYLQRLGGHIDEARRTLAGIRDGQILPWLGGSERGRAATEIEQRLAELEQLRTVLMDAPAWWRPAALLRHGDWSIARRAADDFVPAIPLDPASLLWTVVGIALAVLLYELCGVPLWFRRRRARTAEAPAPAAAVQSGARKSKPKTGT